MNDEQWELIERVFHAARELNPEERLKLLDEECGTDDTVRSTIETLLREDGKRQSPLDSPIADSLAATLSPGMVIGPYEVVSVAGVGGMGQVYRAVDRRLKRDVAIKALPIEFNHDRQRLARLQREATALASVNHPNVATIYDVLESEGAPPCLILEFVHGSTLAESLDNGPFTVEKTLGIAHQIAMALEAAHEKGIVHRDLKPSNIKLTPDGKVKVLDFGLARFFKDDIVEIDPLQPINLAKSAGMYSSFAGTPPYMSPEQARGLPVDQRADLWAFGCVVYELLAGRKAFHGSTASDTVARVLEGEPDWTLLPKDTPSKLHRLLYQCLQKDVSERLQQASDLRRNIEEIEKRHNLSSQSMSAATRFRRHWAMIVAVAATAVAGVLVMSNLRRAEDLRVEQTRQVTFASELELDPAISPNGRMVAYAFRTRIRTDIYVKPLDGGQAINVTKDLATREHRWPRWSPDGLQLAFLATPVEVRLVSSESSENTIYVLRFPVGKPEPIIRASMSGYAWSPDGTRFVFVRGREIYVSSIDGSGLRRIAVASEPNAPSWSPDGRWIVYVSGNPLAFFGPFGNLAPSTLAIVSTDGSDARQLTDKRTTNTSPVWMPDSRSLLFVSNRGGNRDVFELKLSDSGDVLGEPRRITTGLNALSIDLSKDGHQLAYTLFLTKANLWSLPIPKSGPISPLGVTPITTGAQTIEGVRVTRDGTWIAFDSNRSGNQDIYRMLRTGGIPEQLTTDPSDDFLPSWSPDGKTIAFHSFRNGSRNIYVMDADGTNQQQITSDPAHERYPDWSPDGQSLTFFSNKTGHLEVYVVSKRNGAWGQPLQVTSSEGAQFPRWSPDGRTVAYVDVVNGVSVMSPTGQALRHLVPLKPLFPKSVAWGNDSQTIYFAAGLYQGSLWSVPVGGGLPSLLVEFDESHNFQRPEFDTDGKDFFFTMTERESDIWVLQLRK